MRAAVFLEEGILKIQEVEKPKIASSDDVLIRVLACGICGTDLHILDVPQSHPATKGVVLGHEFIGEVEEVGGAVSGLAIGQRVAIRPIVSCGRCRNCLRGKDNHCTSMEIWGVYRNGGLGEYAVVPASACIPLSPEIPTAIAALVEPLACVLSGINRAALRPGEDVVVFGAGAIGLMFTAILRSAGAGKVIVVEISPTRSEVALQLGADMVVNPKEQDVQTTLAEILPHGADVVIDAVGSQFATAVKVSAQSARVILFGMNSEATAEISQFEITEKELSILGSFVGQHNFPDAVRLLESGLIDFGPIVSDVLSLEDLPANLSRLKSGQSIKTVVLTDSNRG
jgi:threonine dehydrogenase-like Zn-dependent dehydrogenase